MGEADGLRLAGHPSLGAPAGKGAVAPYPGRNHFALACHVLAREPGLSQLFDAYDANYREVVQSSIDFSGLPHDFFMQAKVDLIGQVLARRLGASRAGHLLDVGCGVGTLHPYLAGLFDKISGVDVSAPCIEEASRRHPQNSYSVAAPGAAFPGGPYDATLAVCTLHHVPPGDWRAFVADMVRVTRPGGLVCIIEHNPLNPLTRMAVNRCPFDADAVLLRSGRSEDLLKRAGAKNVETNFFLFLPTRMSLARRVEALLRAVPLGAQYLTCAAA